MNIKAIVVVLGTLCLIGCGKSEFSDCQIDSRRFPHNGKAIVVVESSFEPYYWFIPTKNTPTLVWARYDPNTYKTTDLKYKFENKRFFSDTPQKVAYMIDPGPYLIDSIRLLDRNSIHYWDNKGKSALAKQPIYGSIEVHSGEVVYIGDITFTRINGRFNVEVADKYEEALAYLKSEYPEITNEMVKRLVKPGIGVTYSHQ